MSVLFVRVKWEENVNSYVELTFIHNYLINCISLTCSCILSKRNYSISKFHQIIFILTFFASFIFTSNSEILCWILEIICLIIYFKDKTHTYLLFVGFRFLFILYYMTLFFGSVAHHQFFIFDEKNVLISDLILLFFYLILLCKAKYTLQEKDFIFPFILQHKKYIGYMDSGNLAYYHQFPIIFVTEKIFNQLNGEKILIEIQHVNNSEFVEGYYEEIIIDSKKSKVICCLIHQEFKYDALLNMKGIL